MRSLVERAVHAAGHASIAASSCAQALLLARDHRPQAIVFDGRLPTDVAAFVCALRAESASSSVFVLASSEERSVVRCAVGAGARGALLRPVNAQAFARGLAAVAEAAAAATAGVAEDASAAPDAK